MPAKFDRMVDKIWKSISGKKNPKSNKMFTKSDAYAMATAQWKKMHGGKTPESVKDWRLLEFYMPINEAVRTGNDFVIRGVAINETTTRNNVKYIASELEKAAPSFRNKPMLIDHDNSVKSIVGRTTENVVFNPEKNHIEFEGKVMDEKLREMINDGRVTDVSIGARVSDLVENKDEGSVTAIGIEGLEISFVAVPGDPGANLGQALEHSFILKEGMENVNYFEDYELDTELNLKGGNEMVEEEKKPVQEEETVKEPENNEPEENAAEEKLKAMEKVLAEKEKKLAEYQKKESDAKEKARIDKMVEEKIAEKMKEMTPPKLVKEQEEEQEKPEPEDETKGTVGGEETEDVETESLVIEKADTGKGFQIWRDYSKDTGKFKRLSR